MNKREFTLVEMLVVIAIIAILASLLMPILQSSIDLAREISCCNNLRQFAVATFSYSDDHEGFFPAMSGSNKQATQGSYRQLYPYLTGNAFPKYYWYASTFEAMKPFSDPFEDTVYTCPADDHPWANRSWLTSIDSYYNSPKFTDPRIARSYGSNTSLMVYRNTSSGTVWSNYSIKLPQGRPLKVSAVKSPSNALIFMDWWPKYASPSSFSSSTISNYKTSLGVGIDTFGVHNHGDSGGVDVAFLGGNTKWIVGSIEGLTPSDELKSSANAANVLGGH